MPVLSADTPASALVDTYTARMTTQNHHLVLTLVCEDRPGIVHAVTGAVVATGGNITESQQFASASTDRFYMRIQVDTPAAQEQFEQELQPVIDRYDIEHTLDVAGRPLRTLILASTAKHCVNDLLFQTDAGNLPLEVPLILANHDTLAPLAGFYEVPFEHLPVKGAEQKAAFEARVLQAVDEHDVELVVLARYMQILSPELCEALAGRCINIHHSFLPGFKGANPYRQAHTRGVKQIGATAHFVTSDLDEGPIIEQEVQRVTHAQTTQDLVNRGREVEGATLCRAVRWHAQHRVLLDGHRTVVFN